MDLVGELEGPPPTRVLPGFSVAEVSAPALSVVEAMGEEGDRVAKRLERGCRCFAGCVSDDVVAYGWLSLGPEWIGEVGRSISPGPGEAYVWNCVTAAPFRRRGVFRALLAGVASCCRSEGLARLWLGSVPGGALSAVAAAGFAPVLSVSSWSGGRVRVLWARPVSAPPPPLLAAGRRALGLGRAPLVVRAVRGRRH